VLHFSQLKIDPKQTHINATGFVRFSEAMGAYKGGPGLLDAVSTIVGAKLSLLFGADSPLDSFKKFAAIDVGPKAAENSEAFLNFSKAMGMLSGGSGGLLSGLASGAASVAGAAVGTVASLGGAALSALGSAGSWVGSKLSGAFGSFGNWIMDAVASHEGVRTKPYKDSLGLWTIGVGHLIGDGKSLPPQYNREFSKDEIKTMFQQDYQRHAQAASGIPGFNLQNEKSKGALIDMTFNMGPGWYRKWPNFTRALAAGDNQNAANQLQGSKWAGQVGRRAQEDIAMIRAGAQKAKVGGLFEGPTDGYPMELHGTELVIPISANSVLSKLASTSTETLAKDLQHDAGKAIPKPTSTTGTPKKTTGITKEMIHALAIKFDKVVNKIESTNHVQKKLLKHAL
jgi:lysozyme